MDELFMDAREKGLIEFGKEDFITSALARPANYYRISAALAASELWRFDQLDTILLQQQLNRFESN